MKIKILKNDAYCLGKYLGGGHFEVGNCSLDECDLDPLVRNFLGNNPEHPCIDDEVDVLEKFFCAISSSAYIAHLQFYEKHYILNIDRCISSHDCLSNLELAKSYIITSYFPSDLKFLDGDACILTTDGLVQLEEGFLVGMKDGVIQEMSPKDVLESQGSVKTPKSPSYGSLVLTPRSKYPKRPRKGEIVYNEVSQTLDVYTGTTWMRVGGDKV